MNRGKIIVVEGPSNSGKTTTCQNMKNYADCIVIDECMIYEKNPPRPSQNYEQEIQNQLFFFEVESNHTCFRRKKCYFGQMCVIYSSN